MDCSKVVSHSRLVLVGLSQTPRPASLISVSLSVYWITSSLAGHDFPSHVQHDATYDTMLWRLWSLGESPCLMGLTVRSPDICPLSRYTTPLLKWYDFLHYRQYDTLMMMDFRVLVTVRQPAITICILYFLRWTNVLPTNNMTFWNVWSRDGIHCSVRQD